MINCHSFKISRIEHTSISSNKGSVDCTDVFRNQIFKGKQMNRFESVTKPLMWFMALLLTALVAGCGGGSQDPILGGGGAGVVPPIVPPVVAPVAPGVGSCVAAVGFPLIPQILSSNPTDGNLLATASTTGILGKRITATFSLPMAAATLNEPVATTAASTFSLRETLSSANVAGTVTMNAANTIATLETPAALTAGMGYTATITTAATATDGTPLACTYEWSFTVVAGAGLAAIDMGLATPFGISATAGMNTAISSSTVNADVLLDPLAQCNTTAVDGAGGIGSCLAIGFPPTITGTVISSLYDPTGTMATVKADLNTAYLSLCPAGVPDAACSLNGGTVIGAAAAGIGGGVGAPCVYNINAGNCFTPGVYTAASTITVTGDLTLDAQGDQNAVFVFQAGSTVGTAAGAPGGIPGTFTRILLINGAKASNVWWLAGSSATVGTYGEFQGNILAAFSVTLDNGATSCGRMMAGSWVGGGGAITLGGANVVSVPGQPFAPPAGYSPICQ